MRAHVVLGNFQCRGSLRFQQSCKKALLLGCATTRLTMCEVSCYIYKVPRVILAFLYAVGFTACDWYAAHSA